MHVTVGVSRLHHSIYSMQVRSWMSIEVAQFAMAVAKGDAPAKSFVTRGGQTVFKNTLDSPFRLEWPEISHESTEKLLDEVRRSFAGMQELQEQRRRRKKGTPRKQPGTTNNQMEIPKSGVEPPTKKQCLRDVRGSSENAPVDCSEETPSGSPHDHNQHLDGLRKKHSQVLIGINSVTRELEKDGLRAGIVCLSAVPLLRRHLLMLAATRGVPFAGLKAFSKTAAPLLGIKTALAVGFKKLRSPGPDFFQDLVGAIPRLAPPLDIPWLTVAKRSGSSLLEQTQSDLAEKKNERVDKHDFSCGDSTSKSAKTTEQLQSGSREEMGKSCFNVTKEGRHDRGEDKHPHQAKSKSGRKWRKQKQRNKRKVGSFVAPEVQYFPQNIKRTIIRPKKIKTS